MTWGTCGPTGQQIGRSEILDILDIKLGHCPKYGWTLIEDLDGSKNYPNPWVILAH